MDPAGDLGRRLLRVEELMRHGDKCPQAKESDTLGDAVGSRFIVLKGLTPGGVAVIRGNERLRPGQAVKYQNGAAAASK